VKQLPPPNADEVKANLYQAIARRRGDARQARDQGCAARADRAGVRQRDGEAERQGPQGAHRGDRGASLQVLRDGDEIGGVESDPLEFAEEPAIIGDAKAVGVGVGVGSSPQFREELDLRRDPDGEEATVKAPAATRQPVKKK